MKLLLAVIAVLALLSLLDSEEVVLVTSTALERCMNHLGGSTSEFECNKYKE